jgi:DNA invertase Pin-like site-specific DNA recombinase
MHFGYARVSAKDQHLDTQLAQLTAAGVDRLFQEKISGATTQRPELDHLLTMLRPQGLRIKRGGDRNAVFTGAG